MDTIKVDKMRHILLQHFPKTDWNISQPKDGQHRTSYLAQSEELYVFIKFDTPIDALQRLSEIGVAPRILASGLDDGMPYIVQEYIIGKYPDELHAPEIVSAFDKLKNQAHTLHSDKMVPVHPDPNTKHLLLVDTRLMMVDWDNLQLSDPMRDAGLLLWWYVSPKQWPIFFQAYGLVFEENLDDRIFWWAARTSFAIALWQH